MSKRGNSEKMKEKGKQGKCKIITKIYWYLMQTGEKYWHNSYARNYSAGNIAIY
jgi:hypothetical protein